MAVAWPDDRDIIIDGRPALLAAHALPPERFHPLADGFELLLPYVPQHILARVGRAAAEGLRQRGLKARPERLFQYPVYLRGASAARPRRAGLPFYVLPRKEPFILYGLDYHFSGHALAAAHDSVFRQGGD